MKRKLKLRTHIGTTELSAPRMRTVHLRDHRSRDQEKVAKLRKAWGDALDKASENSPLRRFVEKRESIRVDNADYRVRDYRVRDYRVDDVRAGPVEIVDAPGWHGGYGHPSEQNLAGVVVGSMYRDMEIDFLYVYSGSEQGWIEMTTTEAAVTLARSSNTTCGSCEHYRMTVQGTEGEPSSGECLARENSDTTSIMFCDQYSSRQQAESDPTDGGYLLPPGADAVIQQMADRVARDIEDIAINGTPRTCEDCEHWNLTHDAGGGDQPSVGTCPIREQTVGSHARHTLGDFYCERHSRIRRIQIHCENCQYWTETSRGSLPEHVPMGQCGQRHRETSAEGVCSDHTLRSGLLSGLPTEDWAPVPGRNGGRYMRHPVSNQILMTNGDAQVWVNADQVPGLETTERMFPSGTVIVETENGVRWSAPEAQGDTSLNERIDNALNNYQQEMNASIEEAVNAFTEKARVRMLRFAWQFMLGLSLMVAIATYLAEQL